MHLIQCEYTVMSTLPVQTVNERHLVGGLYIQVEQNLSVLPKHMLNVIWVEDDYSLAQAQHSQPVQEMDYSIIIIILFSQSTWLRTETT
jgi:hypothetical protein